MLENNSNPYHSSTFKERAILILPAKEIAFSTQVQKTDLDLQVQVFIVTGTSL